MTDVRKNGLLWWLRPAPKIKVPVPKDAYELLHLSMERLRGSLARAEVRAVRDLVRSDAAEYVMLNGLQLPVYEDRALRALAAGVLHEHAMELYQFLGRAKIGMAVPMGANGLVGWILRKRRMPIELVD